MLVVLALVLGAADGDAPMRQWRPARPAFAADPPPAPPPKVRSYPPFKVQAKPAPPAAPLGHASFVGGVELFDANPTLMPAKLAAELYPNLASQIDPAQGAGGERPERRRGGAVADGLSRLLVRVQLDRPGRVAFRLAGSSGDLGHIRALGPHSSTAAPASETDTFARDGLHVAYAIYTPPRTFDSTRHAVRQREQTRPDPLRPGRTRTLALETRDVELVAEARRPDGTRSATLVWVFKLYRPPIVLVHGTYDNAITCWDWDRGDRYRELAEEEGSPAYVTESLARQLEVEGFGVFLVNYRQSNGTNPDFDTTVQPPTRAEAESGRPTTFDPELDARRMELASRRSGFADNAWVLAEGGRLDAPDPGEGIHRALEYYRTALQVAATRVDVVAHSLGGVLARVYARGVPLAEPPDRPGPNWYRRLDNWMEGDISRLITVGTTHKGSHLPGLLVEYWRSLPLGRGRAWRAGNWAFSGQLAPGAFTDQVFDSEALRALGPTRVPAHAIAGVATARDLEKFDQSWFTLLGLPATRELNYRQRVETLWRATPDWFLAPLFRAQTRLRGGGPTDRDGADLASMKAGIDRARAELAAARAPFDEAEASLTEALAKVNAEERAVRGPGDTLAQLIGPAWMFPEGKRQRIEALGAERQRLEAEIARNAMERTAVVQAAEGPIALLEERRFLRFVSAGFNNDWTDFTVSLDSAAGGLAVDAPDAPERSRYVTVIPRDFRTAREGVLHTYEPRHRAVQARIKELLRSDLGPSGPFKLDGFPGYAPPRYLEPDAPDAFRPHEADCAHAPRLCPAGGG